MRLYYRDLTTDDLRQVGPHAVRVSCAPDLTPMGLSGTNVAGFGAAIEQYAGSQAQAPALCYPGADLPLRVPTDRQFKQLRSRRSVRRFSARPLDERRLGSLLAAFATTGEDGSRVHGSPHARIRWRSYASVIFQPSSLT